MSGRKEKVENKRNEVSLMQEMNIFEILCKTPEVLIPLPIPTERQLCNSFQNNTSNDQNLAVMEDLPNNYRNSLLFQVPRGNLMP